MLKKFAILIIFFLFFFYPSKSKAQFAEDIRPFVFTVNDLYSVSYTQLGGKSGNYGIPQYYIPKPFMQSEELHLEINKASLGTLPAEIPSYFVMWDFGNGALVFGDYAINYKYQKAGTYVITAYLAKEDRKILVGDVLLHIVQDDSYQLPVAVIDISRYENLKRKLTLKISFTGAGSKTQNNSANYMWTTDGETFFNSKNITWIFNKSVQSYYVILKIVDDLNFYDYTVFKIVPENIKTNNLLTARIPVLDYISVGSNIIFKNIWLFLIILLFFLSYEQKSLKLSAVPFAYFYFILQGIILITAFFVYLIFPNLLNILEVLITLIKYVAFMGSLWIYFYFIVQKLKKENIYIIFKKKYIEDKIDYIPATAGLLSMLAVSRLFYLYIIHLEKSRWVIDFSRLVNLIIGQFLAVIAIAIIAAVARKILLINKSIASFYQKYLVILFLVINFILLFIYWHNI